MSRKRFQMKRYLLLMLAAIASLYMVLPAAALAQGGKQMHLNLVENRTWPDITVNLTLTGPDGKAIPDLNAGQFQVTENGVSQKVVGLALGPERSVPLAVVLA